MSKREIKIDAVSWKNRKALSHGIWVSVDKNIDLKDIVVGQSYNAEISQLLDGRYIIDKIILENKNKI